MAKAKKQRDRPGLDAVEVAAMTPADHGYVRCTRCKTWRRPEHMTPMESGAWGVCVEVAWCSQQAGVGKGELAADTGTLDEGARHQGGSDPCPAS